MTDEDKPLARTSDPYAELMAQAIAQGESGVAALERLVALQERREAAEAARAYNAALADAQSEFPPIPKMTSGAHGARYANLDAIMARIGPCLTRHGLSVSYESEDTDDGRLRVTCIVRHASGHAERSTVTISREQPSQRMNATQRDGAAITYGRRYALGQALGITTGERDTDGQVEQGASVEPVTEDQAANLRALCEEVNEDVGAFLERAGVDTFAGFPARLYRRAVKYLEAKR